MHLEKNYTFPKLAAVSEVMLGVTFLASSHLLREGSSHSFPQPALCSVWGGTHEMVTGTEALACKTATVTAAMPIQVRPVRNPERQFWAWVMRLQGWPGGRFAGV